MSACAWGAVGFPACRAGTRGTRYWCAPCASSLDPRPTLKPADVSAKVLELRRGVEPTRPAKTSPPETEEPA